MNDEQQLAELGKQKSPTNGAAVVHLGVKCHKCGVMPICGIRYRCSVCFDFDYCEQCEALHHDKHPKQHYLLKIRHPVVSQSLKDLQFIGIGDSGPIDAFFEPDE